MSSCWAIVTFVSRAPVRSAHRGPGLRVLNTIYRRNRRFVVSAPAVDDGIGCEDRVSVTGDHLSFDGDCGVRPGPGCAGRRRAIQRCSALPFLCFSYGCCGVAYYLCCSPVPEPHANFMAPPRAAFGDFRAEALNQLWPHRAAPTRNPSEVTSFTNCCAVLLLLRAGGGPKCLGPARAPRVGRLVFVFGDLRCQPPKH